MTSTPDLSGAAKWIYPPKIPLDSVVEVAKLANIPAKQVCYFAEMLQENLEVSGYYYLSRPERLRYEQALNWDLDSVAKVANKLALTIAQLDANGRIALGRRLVKCKSAFIDAKDEEDLQRLDDLVRLAEELCEAAQTKRKKTKGGRPRKRESRFSASYDPLAFFVESLERSIVFGGGRTTFNKNDGTGGLAEILRTLAPYLPIGFVPQWIVEPENFLTVKGATAIFEVKRTADIWYGQICDIISDISDKPVPREVRYLGNTIFYPSCRIRWFKKIGQPASRPPRYLSTYPKIESIPSHEVCPAAIRRWRKTPWKKAGFFS